MPTKQEITEAILSSLPDSIKPSLDTARLRWWYNIRDNGGLRLTNEGFNFMTQVVELDQYQIPIPGINLSPGLLLALDQKMHYPYFIQLKGKNPFIAFFSSKEATLVGLYGDIAHFLSNYGR